MTRYYLLRWLLFFLVGIPFQILLYLVYPFLVLYFFFFVKNKTGTKISPPAPSWTVDELINLGKQDEIRDTNFLNNEDPHNALTHVHFWVLRPELAKGGLKQLIQGVDTGDAGQGCVRRRAPIDWLTPVSGDCLTAWTKSYNLFGGDKEDLRRLAWHYLRNCMGLGSYNDGWQVSARSSNGGVNTVFDGWKQINQPAIGPAYYTSASLFLLAARELGGIWNLVYYVHYWVMGGWLWWIVPTIYVSREHFYYSQHITLLNLHTLYKVTGNPTYKWAMRFIVKVLAPFGNVDPLFYCWLAEAGALTKEEIEAAIANVRCIKRDWPQIEPMNQAFYDTNARQFSLVGAAAKFLSDSLRDK